MTQHEEIQVEMASDIKHRIARLRRAVRQVQSRHADDLVDANSPVSLTDLMYDPILWPNHIFNQHGNFWNR